MATDIQPGQWIRVKVTSQPRAAASVKTMIRIFERDPDVVRERRRLSRSRPVRRHQRGGRLWADRPQRLQIVKTTPGASYKLFGSVDVLRDLESIARHVEITPA